MFSVQFTGIRLVIRAARNVAEASVSFPLSQTMVGTVGSHTLGGKAGQNQIAVESFGRTRPEPEPPSVHDWKALPIGYRGGSKSNTCILCYSILCYADISRSGQADTQCFKS